MATQTLTIPRRYTGPPGTANGGYTCGRVARLLDVDAVVTVTLRLPPPLETLLTLHVHTCGDVTTGRLTVDEALIAEAGTGGFVHDPVRPVSVQSAHAAELSYAGLRRHPFPGCFVCGTGRDPADALRLSPGQYMPGQTACVWVPDVSLATRRTDVVDPELGWAALDCPGGWTSALDERPLVLGRMTAHCSVPLRVGRPHVVVGQLVGAEGRKTFTATALYDEGRLVGRAEHTWIAVDPATFRERGPS